MIKAATYGKGRKALAEALFTRKPFQTGGALRGNTVHAPNGTPPYRGQLNDAEWAVLREDAETLNITYVVYSCHTPIAWVRGDGEVYRVEQKFSTTTSKHQGMTYMMTHDMR